MQDTTNIDYRRKLIAECRKIKRYRGVVGTTLYVDFLSSIDHTSYVDYIVSTFDSGVCMTYPQEVMIHIEISQTLKVGHNQASANSP